MLQTKDTFAKAHWMTTATQTHLRQKRIFFDSFQLRSKTKTMGSFSQLRHSGLPLESIQWAMAIMLAYQNQGGMELFSTRSGGDNHLESTSSVTSLVL